MPSVAHFAKHASHMRLQIPSGRARALELMGYVLRPKAHFGPSIYKGEGLARVCWRTVAWDVWLMHHTYSRLRELGPIFQEYTCYKDSMHCTVVSPTAVVVVSSFVGLVTEHIAVSPLARPPRKRSTSLANGPDCSGAKKWAYYFLKVCSEQTRIYANMIHRIQT